MKRLSVKQIERFKRNIKRRAKRKKKRINRIVVVRKKSTFSEFKITAPEIMSFSRNYQNTVEFLDEFRTKTLSGSPSNDRFYIDLTAIKDITIPVAIVLAADFERWSLSKAIRLRIREVKKWNPKVISLFNDLGVFKLLNLPNPRAPESEDNITLFPLQSGLETEGHKVNRMQTQFSNILKGFTQQPLLYEGITEAVENAIAHAYPDDYEPRHVYAGHRWWGASCIDLSSNLLRFFVYDQGSGIPYTIPRSGFWEKIREKANIVLLKDDGFILEKAFEIGRTQTGNAYRGLGFAKMLEVAESNDDSFFRVISGKGEVRCKNATTIENLTHTHHIGGTLIEWRIPINAFNVERSEEVTDGN